MLENLIRKLAKETESQNSFSACKELHSLKLFENDKDLSKIQHIYLSYLFMYYNLYMDIALKKITDIVLKNEIYEDAYMYYKKEKKEDKKEKKDHDVHLVFSKKQKKRKK